MSGVKKKERIIAIKVDEETWQKWKELNKLNNIATSKTRKFIENLFERYSWWFEEEEEIINGACRKGEKVLSDYKEISNKTKVVYLDR